ncbi:hypothetical protein R3W88_021085 [Solanum pinnatisectum]|uniref:Uncharacterized protein n=1 Tax=Solanum pinnatisectum TaxID=50273 RepID=A0AAV9LUQ6_9SOLN|nr:hypothetical protein R3W88_021085 [Solanum pinnatisectum]
MDSSRFCSNLTKLFHLHAFHGGTGTRRFISRGYLITSCPKLQELTIECGVVGIAVEPFIQFLRAKSISCGAVKLLQSVEMRYFISFEIDGNGICEVYIGICTCTEGDL